jgi:hypothetical protein
MLETHERPIGYDFSSQLFRGGVKYVKDQRHGNKIGLNETWRFQLIVAQTKEIKMSAIRPDTHPVYNGHSRSRSLHSLPMSRILLAALRTGLPRRFRSAPFRCGRHRWALDF